MGKNLSNYLFCPFGFLFGHVIKILLTKLGRTATASGLNW